MKLFTIDPSSTSIGYAVMTGYQQLVECGRITPSDSADKVHDRLPIMAMELCDIVESVDPDQILIEIPADQAPHGKAGAQGQAKYGFAVGFIYAELLKLKIKIDTIQSDKWLRSVHRCKSDKFKAATRYGMLENLFGRQGYTRKRDPNQDIADAIELGMKWHGDRMKNSGAAA